MALPYVAGAFVSCTVTSIASRPTSVTIAKRPFCRDRTILALLLFLPDRQVAFGKSETCSCCPLVVATKRTTENVGGKFAGQYLSNGLIFAQQSRERKLAQPQSRGGVSKALNAAWIRPFLFLIFIVIVWDLTIRLFRIPPYQIPAPVMADHLCNDLRFPPLGPVRNPGGDADRGIENGGELRLSAAGVLPIG